MAWINKPKKQTEYKTENEKIRKSIYNTTKWRRLRKSKLISNPLCEICLQTNTITPAVDIHHIISFVGVADSLRRKEIAYDYNNLQALCKVCHQKIHN